MIGIDTPLLAGSEFITARNMLGKKMMISSLLLSKNKNPSFQDFPIITLKQTTLPVAPAFEIVETRIIVYAQKNSLFSYSQEVELPVSQKIFDVFSGSWQYVENINPGQTILVDINGNLYTVLESFMGERDAYVTRLLFDEFTPIFITEKKLLATVE